MESITLNGTSDKDNKLLTSLGDGKHVCCDVQRSRRKCFELFALKNNIQSAIEKFERIKTQTEGGDDSFENI